MSPLSRQLSGRVFELTPMADVLVLVVQRIDTVQTDVASPTVCPWPRRQESPDDARTLWAAWSANMEAPQGVHVQHHATDFPGFMVVGAPRARSEPMGSVTTVWAAVTGHQVWRLS